MEAEFDFLGYVYLRTVLFLQETLRCGFFLSFIIYSGKKNGLLILTNKIFLGALGY